ncbi:MAG: epimerase [Candidatus Eisenbacteria bacterium]|nr:epimerase [Candidatus Eisenbacteria bacterium]
MRILFIGGTRFVGRHLVELSLARGHEVTLFHRGVSHQGLFPGIDERIGDRDGGLDALKGDHWDACIDTCGYFPRVVRASTSFLAGSVIHYTFISSISVYKEFSRPRQDETSELATTPDETVEEITNDTYGALKALCERAAEEEMPGGVLHVRAGLIVGPHDLSDRFTYWPTRVARGGEVLAPGDPKRAIQFIDVRDLGAWILSRVEVATTGVFNVTGPAAPLSMETFLESCRRVVNSDARFTWVPDDVLAAAEARAYLELPLWIPGMDDSFVCRRAIDFGLSFRPHEETIRDTLAWAATRPADHAWRAGLSPQREADILARFRA